VAKPASPSQVSYLRHLVQQAGGTEPNWDTLTDAEASTLIDGLKAKRGKPVWYGNGQFSHWEKKDGRREGMTALVAARVAARFLQAAYFEKGTIVLFGKYKNHRGKVVGFGEDKWGNPTIEIEPIPKGRKQNRILGLYRIWRADVKEKALAEQARERNNE
jgi:hypothetical protein